VPIKAFVVVCHEAGLHPIWAKIKLRDGNWDAEDCHDCWRTAAGGAVAGPGSSGFQVRA
jgi:hypothetical protein